MGHPKVTRLCTIVSARECVYVCVRTNRTAAFVIVYNEPPQPTIAEIPHIIIYDELIQYNIYINISIFSLHRIQIRSVNTLLYTCRRVYILYIFHHRLNTPCKPSALPNIIRRAQCDLLNICVIVCVVVVYPITTTSLQYRTTVSPPKVRSNIYKISNKVQAPESKITYIFFSINNILLLYY